MDSDWYILVGLVIMLLCSFLKEHCVHAIQRTSDDSLNLASKQQDQEHSIGCNECHCDSSSYFALYICLGVTPMMEDSKPLETFTRIRCPYSLTANALPVDTPVFAKLWVLATIAVFLLQSPNSASRMAGSHHGTDDGKDEQRLQGQHPCRKASAFQKATRNLEGPGSPCGMDLEMQARQVNPPRTKIVGLLEEWKLIFCTILVCRVMFFTYFHIRSQGSQSRVVKV